MLTEEQICYVEHAIKEGRSTLNALAEIGKDPRNDPNLHKWLIDNCEQRFKAAKSERIDA